MRDDRRWPRSIRVMGWGELAEHVRRCRALTDKSQRAFGREAGLSERTVRKLESGVEHSYDLTTIDRVEAILGWEHGSFTRVVEGRKPIDKHDPYLARILAAWPKLSLNAQRAISNAVADAAGDADT